MSRSPTDTIRPLSCWTLPACPSDRLCGTAAAPVPAHSPLSPTLAAGAGFFALEPTHRMQGAIATRDATAWTECLVLSSH